MLQLIDRYILKRYLGTFITLMILFIPIGILANLAEKIDNLLENDVTFFQALKHYGNFTIHFANLLFPLLLFISVIWFTSKLANNTEIIAILSSGVSFNRFLRPYLIGATIVTLIAVLGGMFIVPRASKSFNEFNDRYLRSRRRTHNKSVNLYRKINDNEVIYASRFDSKTKRANKFTLEHFEENKLQYKIAASELQFIENDSTFRLTNYIKRTITDSHDIIERKEVHDTLFTFDINQLTPVSYVAETLTYPELKEFMEAEERRGSPNINNYKVVLYKRWSIPISAYILTIIAVAVSSIKKRGGMGVNLAIGLVVAFGFVFFDKVFSTLAIQSSFSPAVAVWLPNVVFAIVALHLIKKAKR